ncbi:MAG: tetratricopeptide repeat protein [Ghiorsea sp.]
MRTFKYTAIVSALLLSACATAPTKATNQPSPSPQKAHVSLERMDAQFLYLAAQRSLDQGQPVLAIRFLKALLRKDVAAVEPRLELADLLMATGKAKQFKEAKLVLEQMPEAVSASLDKKNMALYQLYYARTLLVAGDSAKALLLLTSLLKDQPDHSQVRLLMVRIHVLKKEFKQAHILLKQGMKQYDDIRLRQMQVRLFLQQKKFKRADKALAKMLQKYPDNEDIVLQRSHLAEKQGKVVKAERHLQRYIALHADVAVLSYSALAGLYVRQERFAEAVKVYHKMLPLTAGSADVYMSLGKVHYQTSSYTLAAEAFDKAVLQLTPQKESEKVSQRLAAAYFYLAASLEAAHDWQKAVPIYQNITSAHAFYLDAQLRLAHIEIAQKDEQVAEKRLLHLKTLFADKLEVHEVLSGLRVQQKAYATLLNESNEGLDLGYSSVLLFNRAIAFDALKQFEQLDEALDRVLSQEPEHDGTLNFYGYSLAERNVRLDEARNMLKKALKLKPNDGYYLDSLAWVYFKQKKYKRALKVQLQAIGKIGNDPVMQEHLADMYWQVGQHEQARESWQLAIDLKHEHSEKIQDKILHGLK